MAQRIKKPKARVSDNGQSSDDEVVYAQPTFAEESAEVVSPPVDGQDGLARGVVEYDNEYQLAKHWEERRKSTQVELIGSMRAAKVDEVQAETEREKLKGKIVEQERPRVNPDKLKKALGAKAWRKITTPAIDEDKLDAAIKLGEVDPNVVAACTETTTIEYVKVTRRTKKK